MAASAKERTEIERCRQRGQFYAAVSGQQLSDRQEMIREVGAARQQFTRWNISMLRFAKQIPQKISQLSNICQLLPLKTPS